MPRRQAVSSKIICNMCIYFLIYIFWSFWLGNTWYIIKRESAIIPVVSQSFQSFSNHSNAKFLLAVFIVELLLVALRYAARYIIVLVYRWLAVSYQLRLTGSIIMNEGWKSLVHRGCRPIIGGILIYETILDNTPIRRPLKMRDCPNYLANWRKHTHMYIIIHVYMYVYVPYAEMYKHANMYSTYNII